LKYIRLRLFKIFSQHRYIHLLYC